ncbi:MAG: hypothetical protein COV29_03475 [Candidatus Yanofskybacteria bacterium CG10_big_fil_rev_8_21_14_0_10_36_16]|uniref:Uncharacterized protein n=1 Tax=Candidatus Yanofskybacteria bacterium CG10_big_fil_rev_8_21_14_0_10_36_16 TaxID=1975096 RepID=A0A2J0Q9V2_9BACT|nr:MAG: hypothetical protein COV29_03475 [Candidatus Yanofskybacteria bacterium CG10_big_fil_rev_8_21_14_0_10_36_16]
MTVAIGTYKCTVCKKTYDSTELPDPHLSRRGGFRIACADPFCGATLVKVSDKPKKVFMSQ